MRFVGARWPFRAVGVSLGALAAALLIGTASASAAAQQYVVILKDGSSAAQVAADAKSDGVTPSMTYNTAVSGFAGPVSSAALARLKSDPNVVMATPDVRFTATSSHPQRIPRGWRGPHGGYPNCNTGAGNLGDGTSSDTTDEYPPETTYQQFIPTPLERVALQCSPAAHINGHGTEVSSVLAADDNSFGLVGTAPGVKLYAVKVLNSQDGGELSNIICGVDWVTAHRNLIDVANLSLEGPGENDNDCGLKNHDALHYAICRSVAKGITYVVAAGNDSSSTQNVIPAAYPEVITVAGYSDTDGLPGGTGPTCDGYDDDVFAPFSNYGPSVDLMAVATCITAEYNDGTLVFDDGTSFAAPAVSGAAADLLARYPYLSPEAVKLYLQATAEYGGHTNSHGYGLLDMTHD